MKGGCRRRVGGHHHDGALTVAAVEGLVEVGLLCLGGNTGGRTAALHVHEYEGQLGDHGQTEGLGLQGETGTGGGGHGEVAGVCGTDGGTDAGDLILALEGLGLELLVDGQLLEDSGGGGDGIRAAEERHT